MGFLKGLGKILGGAAKVASLVPGVGTLAGAGLGAAGGLVSGGGLKGMVTGGAMGAAGPLAGKLLGGAAGAGAAAGAATGAAGKTSFLKGLGGQLLKNAPTIIGARGAAQGAKSMSRGNALQDQATQLKMREYADLGPVRQRAIAQALMGAAKAPNLASVYRDPTNAFSRNQAEPLPPPPGMPDPNGPPPPPFPPGMGGGSGAGPGVGLFGARPPMTRRPF